MTQTLRFRLAIENCNYRYATAIPDRFSEFTLRCDRLIHRDVVKFLFAASEVRRSRRTARSLAIVIL
jgi:hypothetical protein